MIGRTTAATLFAALLLATTPCHAVEGENLAEKVGKWTFTMNEPGPDMKKLGAARLKSVRGNLQEIVRQITALPVMSPPKGFEARFWGSANARDRYDICAGKKCPPSRPNGVLALMIGSYGESGGKVKAAFNRPATMDIAVNNLGIVFSSLPVLNRDSDGFLLPEPQRDGERQGMPVYKNDGRVVAVLTRSSNPLWVPVSRERYLQASIAKLARDTGQPPADEVAEKKPGKGKGKKGKKGEEPGETAPAKRGMPIIIEEGRSWVDPDSQQEWVERSRTLSSDMSKPLEIMKERLGTLQEELASLTPEQRQQQARVDISSLSSGESPSLLPLDSTGGVGVVTPNFDFFDRKLPADAVQLVTVQWKFDGVPVYDPEQADISENLHNGRLLEIYKGIDWKKLAEKLPLR